MSDIKFEIKKEIGILSESTKGWKKELNLISWNDKEPKYDIREWSHKHDKMGKGITLTIDELKKLNQVLNEMFQSEQELSSSSLSQSYCTSNGDLIETPNGLVNIETLHIGDEIFVGILSSEKDMKLNWNLDTVKLIDYEIPVHGVYITYGQVKEMVVNPDYVFMLHSGKFTTANKLTTEDQLVDMEGNPVRISSVNLCPYNEKKYNVTVNMDFDGSVSNHLIILGGIVSGDFTLQLHFNELDENLIK